MNKNSNIGFATILGLIFIVLKLTKIINWSWLWVLSPFWIGAIFAIILMLIYIYMS